MDITQEEAELYDRQIRVWGVDAQKSIRAAHVLLVGISGLNTEVAKNLVLSGIKHVTLLDDHVLTEQDLGCQFHCDASAVGSNRATSSVERIQVLNPNVEVVADESPLSSKTDEFFKEFQIVCVTGITDLSVLARVDEACRSSGTKFYCGDTFGLTGYFFCDLGDTYNCIVEKKGDGGETIKEPFATSFVPITDAFSQTWASMASAPDAAKKFRKLFKRTPQLWVHLRALFAFHKQHGRAPQGDTDADALVACMTAVCTGIHVPYEYVDEPSVRQLAVTVASELMPVCAIVGGSLCQEIIRGVSGKDAPFNNTYYFDGRTSAGVIVRHGTAVADA